MEQILRRGATAGVAATVVGAGLMAVNPVAPPRLDTQHVPQFGVQLTTAAADAVSDLASDVANAASGVVLIAGGDLWYALGWNVEHIMDSAWDALTDLTQFKLADAVHEVAIGLANVVLIPENLLLGAVSFLTGDWALPNFSFIGEGAPLDPDMWAGLWSSLQDIGTSLTGAVSELFQGHLGVSLMDFFLGINNLIIAIPEQLAVGATAFIWQDLLGLP